MLKVVFVSTFYGENLGGAEISVKKLSDNLIRNGLEIKIISTRPSDQSNVETIATLSKVPKHFLILGNKTSDSIFSKQIEILCQSIQPTLIHAHDLFSIPASYFTAKKLNIPLIITVRDPLPREFYFLGKNIFSNRNVLYKKILQDCSLVVAISNSVRQDLINFGVPESKIKVIYNIPPEWEIEQETFVDNKLHLFSCGRLHKEKGFHILIDAISLVTKKRKDFILNIVGDGPEKNRLIRQIKSLELNNFINMHEKVNNEELKKYYSRSDIVIFPSIYREPLGRVALEAGMCAKPVIASDIGGISEIVQDNVSGLLVEPDDPNSLADAIIKLAAAPEQMKKMGINGRTCVKSTFDKNNIINQTISVYQSL